MLVLVISNFDEDLIKMNVLAWRHHFPNVSLWMFFRRSRAPNSEGSGPIWPNFNLIRDLMPAFITCKFDKDRIKTEAVSVETSFSRL